MLCDRNQERLPASSYSILIIDNSNIGYIGMRIKLKQKDDTGVDSNQTDKSEKKYGELSRVTYILEGFLSYPIFKERPL